MQLDRYLRVIRAHRGLVVAILVLCVAGAAALAWFGPQTHAATAQWFVSAGAPEDSATSYASELSVQQRAHAFAQVAAGDAGAQAVIDELGLDDSADSLAADIEAAVPVNTAVIDITVSDPSADRALAIGQALDLTMPRRLERLEKPAGQPAPVRVSVSTPAQIPDGPVAPRKPAYLAMGALLGLALGIAGAFLMDALARRVRTDDDATLSTGAPVLGRVFDHGGPGTRAIMLSSPASPAADSCRDLAFRLRAVRREHELRSLLVASPNRGDGRTEIVANLGLASAEAGERVVVVDGSLRSPALARRVGVRTTPGLADLLVGRTTTDRALHVHGSGLEVLSAGSPRRNPGELLDSSRLEGLIAALSQWFDLVIVDSPPLLAVNDAAALARAVDSVLLVARPTRTSERDLAAARKALSAARVRPLGLVLNRVPAASLTRERRWTPVGGASG